MSEGESVKVAVRVRPFNSREKERQSKCCIKMVGNTTIITNPETGKERKFAFDYSYWSHDGYNEEEDGLLVPDGPDSSYADQQTVFENLGRGVLQNAYEGFNTSLFAYGQTGSGKSFSMVGYGVNKGIVPITCDELFQKIESDKGNPNLRYQVSFSMLEIYSEAVRDLLVKSPATKGGLPIRQNGKGKFFVHGLKRVPVASYEEIDRRMKEGTANRTVAATKMNATSSRAHTVVTVVFDQITKDASGKETTKSSEINLVDLAGSERAASTGATGERLKEGSAINKSLSCLGNVISALAEKSNHPKKKVLVPYRDSALTKLLANALGGNSKTIMIAALSPADINYDETLSTLRYADRAKQIKNKAVINESETDKLIRILREENEQLKKRLTGEPVVEQATAVGKTPEELEAMRQEMEADLRAQLEANMQQAMLADQEQWKKALAEAAKEDREEDALEAEQERKKKAFPYFVNLNEDPMLSFVVHHFLEPAVVRIGKPDHETPPEISLTGLSIRRDHAVARKGDEHAVTLEPGVDGAKTKVNGKPLSGTAGLRHHDRVLFGSNHLYLFVNPHDARVSVGTPDTVDWLFAQEEIAKHKGFQTNASGLTKEQLKTQAQVLELLPLISEANAISEELDKHRFFEVILVSPSHLGLPKESGTVVSVKMRDLLNNNEWIWSRGKFFDRRFQFQATYQDWVEKEDPASTLKGVPRDKADPFFEPLEDLLVGTANVYMQSLAYGLDHEETLDVLDYKGDAQGSVTVRAVPVGPNGKPLADEDFYVEDPTDLLGRAYSIKFEIVSADIIKTRFSKGLRCRYTMYGEIEPVDTKVVMETTTPTFEHLRQYDFEKVDHPLLQWFEGGFLNIKVFARQESTIINANLSELTKGKIRTLDGDSPQPEAGAAVGKASPPAAAEADGKALKKLQAEHQAELKKLETAQQHAHDAELKKMEARVRAEFEQRLRKEQEDSARLAGRLTAVKAVVKEFAGRPEEERTYDAFHSAVTAALGEAAVPGQGANGGGGSTSKPGRRLQDRQRSSACVLQ